MTPDIQRLPLERMKDVVDRALKAERGLDGSDPRLRTYANARAKVEKEFWGYHADLLDEIARLTSDLADLKHDMERLMESTTAEATDNVRLRVALVFYRDAQYDPALSDDIHDDRGQRAREALDAE